MKNTKAEKLDFKFLVDRPLQGDNELEFIGFGHRELGQTLTEIVVKCKAPFTIGLHGEWGTGKSTIAYFLRKSLKSKNIPVIIFDVWKHEKDALRRTFLREAVKQLKNESKICKSFTLDERLDKGFSEQITEPPVSFPWRKIGRFIIYVLICFLIIICLDYVFLSSLLLKTFRDKLLIAIVSTLSLITLVKVVTWIRDSTEFFFKNFISSKAISYSIDKFSDPHDFQKQFEEIIKHINDDRILIVFDNLDRVSSDKAIEVLSTIKTFLEPSDELVKEKEVVFLVPCDAQALREHIKSVYVKNSNSSYDPDEFLRKFFNATIWIPDFIPTELDQYTRNKLRETQVPHFDNDIISALITTAFRDNPRQIIQFINILLSNYLLILERTGENKDFAPEFLDKNNKNTEKLCRFLLLQQLYPEIIRKIKSKHIANIDTLTKSDLENNFKEEAAAGQFLDFKNRTINLAPLENARIFYTLRLSNEEKQFIGIERFYEALEDKKIEDAQKFIQDIKEYADRKIYLSSLINYHLEKITNPIIKAKFIDSLLNVLYKEAKDLELSVYASVYTATDSLDVPQLLFIQPDIFTQIVLKDEKWRKKIFNKWILLISPKKEEKSEILDDFLEKLLKTFISNIESLDNEQVEKVKNSIAQPIFYKSWVGKLLTNTIDIQNKFLSPDYIYGFITSLKAETFEQIDIVIKFKTDLFRPDSKQELIKRSVDILNSIKDKKDKEKPLLQVNKLIINKKDVLSDVKEQLVWDQLWAILDQIGSTMSWDDGKIIIPLYFTIWCVMPNPPNKLQSDIEGFIQNSNLKSIKLFLEQIEIQRFLKEKGFLTLLKQRAIQDLEIFDYLYNELIKNDEDKYNLLENFINQDLPHALQTILKIIKESSKLPKEESLISYILSKFDSLDNKSKLNIIEICNLTKCADNGKIKNDFADRIKNQLTRTDKQQQMIVFDKGDKLTYLGNEILRKITTDVFDWIKQQGVSGQYHILSIQFICDLNQLTSEEQDETIYYIFQILRKSNDQSELEVACDLLLKLNPSFEDHQQKFNDFKNRIESERNTDIKKLLINKFFDLRRNSKINRKNKEFWDFIEDRYKDYEKKGPH